VPRPLVADLSLVGSSLWEPLREADRAPAVIAAKVMVRLARLVLVLRYSEPEKE